MNRRTALTAIALGSTLLSFTSSAAPAAPASPRRKAPARPAQKTAVNNRLVKAVIQDDYGKVKQLLASGASANARDPEGGYPALAIAAGRANLAMMKLLLDKGADPNAVGSGNDTALMGACVYGGPEHLKLLLDRGAKLETRTQLGATALYSAIGFNADNTRYLLERGANPNVVDGIKQTPLMAAANASDVESVRYLLARGAKTDLKDHEGKTALQIARDNVRTPIDEEQKRKAEQVVRLLEQQGVKE